MLDYGIYRTRYAISDISIMRHCGFKSFGIECDCESQRTATGSEVSLVNIDRNHTVLLQLGTWSLVLL